VTDTTTDTCTVPTTAVTTLDANVNLAAGDTATITFSAVLDKTDTADVVNTASIKTGVCNPNAAPTLPADLKGHAVTIQCSSTVTNPVPDFTVTKTDTPGNGQSVTAGSVIPYTVAIKNVGDGAGSATITDTLPSNLTIKGTPTCAVTSPDTCTVTNTTGSTWTFAVALAAGDSATVTFSATVAAGATGTVTNTATITTGPCNTSSGCSSTVSNPIPPVTAPAVVFTPTPPPPPVTAPAIAFTGADLEAMWAIAAALLGVGGFMVLMVRRRRKERHAS
jgi:fimbrial isopeptide formation D2 family protein